MVVMSAASFWSPMKSLRSGGITRRTAWGTTTLPIVCRQERPNERGCGGLTPVHALDPGPIHLGDVGPVDRATDASTP